MGPSLILGHRKPIFFQPGYFNCIMKIFLQVLPLCDQTNFSVKYVIHLKVFLKEEIWE